MNRLIREVGEATFSVCIGTIAASPTAEPTIIWVLNLPVRETSWPPMMLIIALALGLLVVAFVMMLWKFWLAGLLLCVAVLVARGVWRRNL